MSQSTRSWVALAPLSSGTYTSSPMPRPGSTQTTPPTLITQGGRRLRVLGLLFAGATLSCVLAAYNGFPLTYSDTGSYLDNAADLLRLKAPWFFFRPLTYGVFLVPFATPVTLWLLPLVQGLMVVAVVLWTMRTAKVMLSLGAWLAVFAVLCTASSLPWFTGQIMPDVFTSVVILLSFVVVWAPLTDFRSRWVVLGLSFAIATHLSHFPIAAGLLLGGAAARIGADADARSRKAVSRLALRAVAPIVLALAAVVGPNLIRHRQPVLSRSSSLFALAHLVGDGSAQRYLARACTVRTYGLCAERHALRPDVDWFLWDRSGPRARSEAAMARGDSTLLREAPAIVAGTLRQEWPRVLLHVLRDGGLQLVTFGAHPGEHSYSSSVDAAMHRLGPTVGASYRASRQARRALPTATPTRIHYAAVIVAIVALGWLLPRLGGPRHRPLRRLTVTVGVGLVLNGFILAGLSTVHPRYQSRVVWLVVLMGLVVAAEWHQGRQRDTAPSTAPSA
jgi:hypothetical protein